MDAITNVSDSVVTDLNTACYRVADLYLSAMSHFDVNVVITPELVDIYFPGQVLNIAVEHGWLSRPIEQAEGMELGDFMVSKEFYEWFVGLLEESLSVIRDTVEEDDEIERRVRKYFGPGGYFYHLTLKNRKSGTPATPKRTPAAILDEYFRQAGPEEGVFTLHELARKCSTRPVQPEVSVVSLSRMSTGKNVGTKIRYLVSSFIRRKIPCEMDDLLWTDEQLEELKRLQETS